MAWDDEKRAKVVKMYVDGNPTPENTMELIKTISEKVGETVNGTRLILQNAEVYVKKAAATTSTKKATKATTAGTAGTSKVSKADTIAELVDTINKVGVTVNEEIIDKLTAKAAAYFTSVIKAAQVSDKSDDEDERDGDIFDEGENEND